MRTVLPALVASLLVVLPAGKASAEDLKLSIANGRVTLVAADVSVRQILAEWARVGETMIVNGDKLAGPPMTLQLIDVPEAEALDALLRAASGYVAASRRPGAAGVSTFDRIMILPTSQAPAASAAVTPPPAAFTRQPQPPPPMPMPMDDPVEMVAEPDDDMMPPPESMPHQLQAVPGAPPFPGAPDETQPILTAPRPGMLPPQPGGVPGNPYVPGQPGQQRLPGQPPVVRPPVQPGQPVDH